MHGLSRISRRPDTYRRWLPLILLAALAAACDPWAVHILIPADLRTPSIAGVVEEIMPLPDGSRTYRLSDEQSANVASQKDVLLGGEPLVGELLLAGTDPNGRQWVAGVSRSTAIGRPAGCFVLPDQGLADDGWIETVDGFQLPKAADFHDFRGTPDDLFGSAQGVFCLNEKGEVTSYDIR